MQLSESIRKKNYKKMVIDYYDLVTKGYIEIFSIYFHPYVWQKGQTQEQALEAYHEFLFKKLKMSGSCRVADYGCGIGSFSFLLTQRFSHVTAVNMNKKQLDMARRTAKSRNIGNITFVEQDIMETSFKEEFDAIFIIDVDPHIPDKKRMLEVAVKALKKNGKIVLLPWCKPEKVSAAANMLIIQPFNAAWGFTYQETPQNYLRYFKDFGLKVVYSKDLTKEIGKSVRAGYLNFLRKINEFKYSDIVKVLDSSAAKNIGKFNEKAHEITQMVLYSIAAYDAGLFLYPLFILQKN